MQSLEIKISVEIDKKSLLIYFWIIQKQDT